MRQIIDPTISRSGIAEKSGASGSSRKAAIIFAFACCSLNSSILSLVGAQVSRVGCDRLADLAFIYDLIERDLYLVSRKIACRADKDMDNAINAVEVSVIASCWKRAIRLGNLNIEYQLIPPLQFLNPFSTISTR